MKVRSSNSRRAVAAVCLSLLAVCASAPARAQDTTGSAFGKVDRQLGDIVRIESSVDGRSRDLRPDKEGRYDAKGLQPGEYTLSLVKGDDIVATQTLSISPGTASRVDFAGGAAETVELEAVNVSSNSISNIDVTTSETSTTFTAEQMREIPVARNPVAVAELTAAATPGYGVFNGLPSFGGSSAAENSFYINGFDVTNLFDNLSFSDLPFESIASEQVLTGGYGPEYNRSTGGVISLTTKRGSNQFDAGGSVYWQPDFLQGREPPVYYGTTTRQTTPLLYHTFYREAHDETEANAWVSGPIVRNHLFYYLLVNKTWTGDDRDGQGRDLEAGTATQTPFSGTHAREPLYLVKLDGAINDTNHLEFTYLNDNTRTNHYGFNESYVGPPGTRTHVDDYLGDTQTVTGGNLYTAKFTSNITDALTFDAQWGQLVYKDQSVVIAPDGTEQSYNGVLGDLNQPGCPPVVDQTTDGADNGRFVSSPCYIGDLSTRGGVNTRTNYRGELDYKFDLGRFHGFRYGAHELVGGYEHDNFNTSGLGNSIAGGRAYRYQQRSPDDTTDPNRLFVDEIVSQNIASSRVIEHSFYLKDNWQIADRVILNLGVRNDGFENRTTTNQTYVKQDNIWQPRLGAAWDVMGDSSMKVFANYGKYSLPITSSVGVREASAGLTEVTSYFYTGVDPATGAPTGLTPTPSTSQDPEGIYHGEGFVLNGQNGTTPNPKTYTDNKLKPIEQSEYILGFQAKVFDRWVATLRAVHRNLDRTIDDSCDGRPIQAAAARAGFDIGNGSSDGSDQLPSGVAACYLINPGRGAALQEPIDVDNPGVLYPLKLSAADIGEPKAKRKYDAVTLELDKAWAQHFFFHGSYTWSHSYGNTEGLVNTATGASGTGITADFDFPELEQGAYGLQGNDHRHNLKLFGAYKPIPDFLIGVGSLLRSGSPYSCYGTNPGNDVYGYGASYHYCNGQLVPQGSAGHTDTITQLDLNLVYTPRWFSGFSVALDIANLFNQHGVESVSQRGESNSGSPLQGPNSGFSNSYGTPFNLGAGPLSPYQSPRTFRFGLRYEFKKQ